MNLQQKIEDRFKNLSARYSAGGLPWTSQRRALIEVLAQRFDHPTVDQIYSDVAKRLPEVSRTTVYRSLEVLTDLKMLKRVEHPGSSVRYDIGSEPHHHFLCSNCEDLSDLPLAAIAGADHLAYTGEQGHKVDEVAILVRGICANCRQS